MEICPRHMDGSIFNKVPFLEFEGDNCCIEQWMVTRLHGHHIVSARLLDCGEQYHLNSDFLSAERHC
jgi:hypothetical protein